MALIATSTLGLILGVAPIAVGFGVGFGLKNWKKKR